MGGLGKKPGFRFRLRIRNNISHYHRYSYWLNIASLNTALSMSFCRLYFHDKVTWYCLKTFLVVCNVPYQTTTSCRLFHSLILNEIFYCLMSWFCSLLNTTALMCRLFNYIQPASRLSPGCDYSLFKVCSTPIHFSSVFMYGRHNDQIHREDVSFCTAQTRLEWLSRLI